MHVPDGDWCSLPSAYRRLVREAAAEGAGTAIEDGDEVWHLAVASFYYATRIAPEDAEAFNAFARSVIARHVRLFMQPRGAGGERDLAGVRRRELERYRQALQKYGISFEDLGQRTPLDAVLRREGWELARRIAVDAELRAAFLRARRLPVVAVSARTGMPSDAPLLTEFATYSTALTLLLSMELPLLQAFIMTGLGVTGPRAGR